MKRTITFIFSLIILAGTFAGCKKFLTTEPNDSWIPEKSYDTELKLTKALAGVYDRLGDSYMYGDIIFSEWEACTDDSYFARNTVVTGLAAYNFDYTLPAIKGYWEACYIGIDRANQLIANINTANVPDDKRNAILGEALFMRGYYYFMLVTRFGGVPLRLESVKSPIGVDLARSSIKEVYDQILKDMIAAEAKVATSSSIGYSSRVSKTVVQGILARVCLHMAGFPLKDESKYAEALSWATKVKNSGEHALRTTYNSSLTNSAYSQIFIDHSQDKYEVKESMWEVDFYGNSSMGYNETGRVGNTMGIAMGSVTFQADSGFCYGFIKATGRLFKLYQTGDLRKNWALGNYTYNGTTGARMPIAPTANPYTRDAAKWRRSYELLRPKEKNNGPTNYPLLRYADVLLMLAEAENFVNGPTAIAYDAINQVRRRGYGLPITTANVISDLTPGLSKSDFQLAIEDERSRELCFESLRRQDLVRWGKLITALKTVAADQKANGGSVAYSALGGENIATRHLLYPIPVSEMTVNKAITKNNEGW